MAPHNVIVGLGVGGSLGAGGVLGGRALDVQCDHISTHPICLCSTISTAQVHTDLKGAGTSNCAAFLGLYPEKCTEQFIVVPSLAAGLPILHYGPMYPAYTCWDVVVRLQ